VGECNSTAAAAAAAAMEARRRVRARGINLELASAIDIVISVSALEVLVWGQPPCHGYLTAAPSARVTRVWPNIALTGTQGYSAA
jgi:hypothetical protein